MQETEDDGIDEGTIWAVAAIACILALLIAVLGYLFYYQYQAGREANRPESQAQRSYEEIELACISEFPSAAEKCAREAMATYREEYRAYADLQAQQDTALWSFYGVFASFATWIVTVVGIAFVALTLREARSTTRAAIAAASSSDQALSEATRQREIAEAEFDAARNKAEPNLTVCGVSIEFVRDKNGLGITVIRLEVENIGSTAAYDADVFCSVEVDIKTFQGTYYDTDTKVHNFRHESHAVPIRANIRTHRPRTIPPGRHIITLFDVIVGFGVDERPLWQGQHPIKFRDNASIELKPTFAIFYRTMTNQDLMGLLVRCQRSFVGVTYLDKEYQIEEGKFAQASAEAVAARLPKSATFGYRAFENWTGRIEQI